MAKDCLLGTDFRRYLLLLDSNLSFAINGPGPQLIGFSAESTALAGAGHVAVADTSAINTNPAALSLIQGSRLDVTAGPLQAFVRHSDIFNNDQIAGENHIFAIGNVGYATRLLRAWPHSGAPEYLRREDSGQIFETSKRRLEHAMIRRHFFGISSSPSHSAMKLRKSYRSGLPPASDILTFPCAFSRERLFFPDLEFQLGSLGWTYATVVRGMAVSVAWVTNAPQMSCSE